MALSIATCACVFLPHEQPRVLFLLRSHPSWCLLVHVAPAVLVEDNPGLSPELIESSLQFVKMVLNSSLVF